MNTQGAGTDGTGSDGPVTWIDISEFSNPNFSYGDNLLRLYGLVLPVLGVGFLPFLLWAILEDILTFVSTDVFAALSVGLAVLWILFLVRVLYGLTKWLTGADAMGSEAEFTDEDLTRILPHNGKSLKDILSGVRTFAEKTGPAVNVRDSAKSGQVWAYRGLAVLVFLLGIGIPWFLGSIGAIGTTMEGALLGGGAGVGTLVAILLFIRAGRASQPDLEFLLKHDTRRPVLFLRSFRDDTIITFRRFRKWLPWAINYAIRFEQSIADRFNDLGPLIAVGEPGEKLPHIGAARVHLNDDEWQDAVIGWVGDARLIVMIAGPTEWIRWELAQILEKQRLGELFILIPPRPASKALAKTSASIEDRWRNIRTAFVNTAWEDALGKIDPDGTLLVRLGDDGTATAIRSSGSLMQDYRLAITVAVYDVFCT